MFRCGDADLHHVMLCPYLPFAQHGILKSPGSSDLSQGTAGTLTHELLEPYISLAFDPGYTVYQPLEP